jgi:hypothetical protein
MVAGLAVILLDTMTGLLNRYCHWNFFAQILIVGLG